MTLENILSLLGYGLIIVYGIFLTVSISGGCTSRRDRVTLAVTIPVLMVLQSISLMTLGTAVTMQLYPILVHLPMLIIMVLALHKPVVISIVSICTAYLCCQLPRCVNLSVESVTGSKLVGAIICISTVVPIYILLQRYFVPSAREAIAESRMVFGGLPIAFYIFFYGTAIYSKLLYSGSVFSTVIFPTLVGLFYMIYTTAYRQQLQKRSQAELLNSLMGGCLKYAETELISLRQAEAQAAAYQHDMRHHLTAIDGFLAAGKSKQAEEYINQVQADIEAITPKRFCENELVNLLCSSFSAKAKRMGVRLTLETSLPGTPAVSDTELCALLSNGLENALNAAETLDEEHRWVDFYCGIRMNKLLIEIKNPYTGRVPFRDGLPSATRSNHGYGCRSIQTISQACRGLCEFKAEGGIFTLRVVLPMLKV